jgi:hypothetical protein
MTTRWRASWSGGFLQRLESRLTRRIGGSSQGTEQAIYKDPGRV